MTTTSKPWPNEWGSLQHQMHIRAQVLSRGQARRMSRRFAGVGVGVPAAHLRAMAAGTPFPEDELADVSFALAATEMRREERHAKFARTRRRGTQWLLVAGLVLLMLNLLICIAYGMFVLFEHASAF
jgi:hypothetical protein